MRALAPIRKPLSSVRIGDYHQCEQCGRPFRPWFASRARRFCAIECVGAWFSERAKERQTQSPKLPIDPEQGREVVAECQDALAELRKVAGVSS